MTGAASTKRQRRTKGDGGFFKRASDGLWVGVVELPADRDGNRRQRRVTAKDRNVALAKLKALRKEIDAGRIPVTDRTTVAAWLEHWITEIAPAAGLKPTAVESYKSVIRAQIVPEIGKKRLGKLTPADIRGMSKGIVESGRATGTALGAYRVLSTGLGAAFNEGLITENPADRVKPPVALRQERPAMSADQMRALLMHLATFDDPLTARWALSLFTGQRQAECLGLEWDRVDFERHEIDVSWTLQWLRLKPEWRRRTDTEQYPREAFNVDPGFEFRPVWRSACLIRPKSKSSKRIVAMNEPLEAALRVHREQSTGSGLVFIRDGGRPLRKIDDSDAWHKTLAAAGVPDMTLHSARHTLATLLEELGISEQTRMAIMGHSSAVANRGYVHVDQTRSRAALADLAQLMAATPGDDLDNV